MKKLLSVLLFFIFIFLFSCKTQGVVLNNEKEIEKEIIIPKLLQGYYSNQKLDFYFLVKEKIIILGSTEDSYCYVEINDFYFSEQNVIEYESVSGTIGLVFTLKNKEIFLEVYLNGELKHTLIKNNNLI